MRGLLAALLALSILAVPACLRAGPIEVCDDETELMDFALLPDAPEGRANLAVVCGPAGPVTVGGHVELWRVEAAEGPGRRVARFDEARNPREIAAGDLDGDGDIDLLLVNGGQHERSLAAILDESDGVFAAPVIVHARGGDSYGPVIHDVNDDGRMDVLLPDGRGWGRSGALINTGDGFSGPFREGPLPGRANAQGRRILFEGAPALAVPLPRSGKVMLYPAGAGEQVEIVPGKAVRQVEAALGGGDLDGDGVPELFVATRRDATTLETRIAASRDGGEWRIGEALPGADDARDVLLPELDGAPGREILIVTRGDLRRGELVARLYQPAGEGAAPVGVIAFEAYPDRIATGDLLPAEGPELVYGTQVENAIRIMPLGDR
ncbi:MAG: FG-GAP-like repeat-containing protein [Pseudomonadota bacterium]